MGRSLVLPFVLLTGLHAENNKDIVLAIAANRT